jgi:hypothetical protein
MWYQIPKKIFCGVSDPSQLISVGSDVPLHKFMQGIRPRGATFEFEYLLEFENKFENNLAYDSGVHTGLIRKKKPETEDLVLLSLSDD